MSSLGRPGGSRARRAVAIAMFAGVLALTWITAAVLTSGRGLDITDESFYLLSYRWWDEELRAFSGVQYLYGPVFDLLGQSVSGLRVFRLVTIVLSHAVFAWAYMTWLRTRRPRAAGSRAWELAGTMVIVASAGITYSWLPLSPGYNDPAMLGTLLVVAVVLRSLRAVRLGAALPLLPALALGPLVTILLLAKWSSAGATLALLAVLAVAGFWAAGAGGWVRYSAVAVASVLVSAAAVNFLVMPFRRMVPPLVEVNRLAAAETNSPLVLLDYYRIHGWRLVESAAPIMAVALAAGAVGWLVMRYLHVGLGRTLVVLGPPLAVLTSPTTGVLPEGGVAALPDVTALLLALALAGAIAFVVQRAALARSRRRDGDAPDASTDQARSRVSDGLVVAMLVLLPVVQGVGSTNPLQYLAVNQYACWVALFVGAVTSATPASGLRPFVASVTATAVVIAVANGLGGLLEHPYRATPYADADTPIGGSSVGSEQLVSADVASHVARIRAVVGAEATPGRPMMAFSAKPGLILLLGGRSVGEAWYGSPRRPSAGIRTECEAGNPWEADRQPIIIYDRKKVTRLERAAFGACGLDLRSDYQPAVVVDGAFGLVRIYLPRKATSVEAE